MTGQTSAPAKVILVGEHAVVYGMPAIALPLSQVRAYADYNICDHTLSVHAEQDSQPLFRWSSNGEAPQHPLAALVRLTARHFGASQLRGKITIRSDIPIASGLGSGAAVSAALGRALAAILKRDLPDGALNDIVYEVEKLHHGTPSGIDNTVVVYEKPVYYIKGKTLDFIRITAPLHLVVADTGIAALTRETVSHVRGRFRSQRRQTRALLENIGALAEQARALVETGESWQLGELMTRNHELLRQLGVSSDALDRLVEAALVAGACGAKLSGGGRGGNIIALVDENTMPTVQAALLTAGAKQVITSSVIEKSASL